MINEGQVNGKVWKVLVTTLVLSSGFTAAATNDRDPRYHQLSEPTIRQISSEELYDVAAAMEAQRAAGAACAGEVYAEEAYSPTEVELSTIVNIGAVLWKIIEKGRSVANQSHGEVAHALPEGVRCWADLENWSIPVRNVYRVEYKNLFGLTVAKYDFAVLYTAGGNYGNQGRYLTNIQVVNDDFSLLWGGFSFDSTASVRVSNAGTRTSPVAQAQINVEWTVKSILMEKRSSASFAVRGNGQFSQLR